jgi:hypothetical protein
VIFTAAAGELKIALTNGQTISIWGHSAEAIGNVLTVNMNGNADTNTTTTDFYVADKCMIRDIRCTSPATGTFDIYDVQASRLRGKPIDLVEFYTVNTNRVPPMVGFLPGKLYRLVVTGVFVT